MKFALGAIEIKDFDKKHNLNEIFKLSKEAIKENCEYIFFGESALNGFDGLKFEYNHDYNKEAFNRESDFLEIKNFCKENQIGIGFGYIEKENGLLYSSFIVFDKTGKEICNYRRISDGWYYGSTFDKNYSCGSDLGYITINNINFDIVLCGDLWTENIISMVKTSKNNYILWPLYVGYDKELWKDSGKNEYLNHIKSIKKRSFFINSYDMHLKRDGSFGNLLDIDKNGNINSEKEIGSEGILVIDLE